MIYGFLAEPLGLIHDSGQCRRDSNSQCIVHDRWHLSQGETTNHVSVIVDNGTGYVILNNTAGAPSNVSSEAKRQ
jgi:hypothetical protein